VCDLRLIVLVYIPYSTFTITTVQLHVSATNVGHLQVSLS